MTLHGSQRRTLRIWANCSNRKIQESGEAQRTALADADVCRTIPSYHVSYIEAVTGR